MNIKRINKRTKKVALDVFLLYNNLTLVLLDIYDIRGEETVIATLETKEGVKFVFSAKPGFMDSLLVIVKGANENEAIDNLASMITGRIIIAKARALQVPNWSWK